MASKKRKIGKKPTITLQEARKIEYENTRRFMEFIRGEITNSLSDLYENNLGISLVAYGRITALRDILRRIEEVSGFEFDVDFMVRISVRQ